MLEILIGAAFGLFLGTAVAGIARVKLSIQETARDHAEKFFQEANEIADWKDLSVERLDRLALMSASLKSRRMQLIVIKALKEVAAEKKITSAKYPDNLSAKEHLLWNRMFFNWLVAVSCQGTFVAIYAMYQLIRCFDPERTTERAESAIYRHELSRFANAH